MLSSPPPTFCGKANIQALVLLQYPIPVTE